MKERQAKAPKEKIRSGEGLSLFTRIFKGSVLILFIGFVTYAILFVLMYFI